MSFENRRRAPDLTTTLETLRKWTTITINDAMRPTLSIGYSGLSLNRSQTDDVLHS